MNLWRYLFAQPVPEQPDTNERPFHCGTLAVHNGGVLLLHTDNVVTILREERDKTNEKGAA